MCVYICVYIMCICTVLHLKSQLEWSTLVQVETLLPGVKSSDCKVIAQGRWGQSFPHKVAMWNGLKHRFKDTRANWTQIGRPVAHLSLILRTAFFAVGLQIAPSALLQCYGMRPLPCLNTLGTIIINHLSQTKRVLLIIRVWKPNLETCEIVETKLGRQPTNPHPNGQ